jgi:hypothetical protein
LQPDSFDASHYGIPSISAVLVERKILAQKGKQNIPGSLLHVVNMIKFRRTLNFLLPATLAVAIKFLSGYRQEDRDTNSYSIMHNEDSSSRETICFLFFSMALKPFEPWTLFQILSPIHSR